MRAQASGPLDARTGAVCATSPPSHGHYHKLSEAQAAPDLLQREFSAELPNTKWVADTTYIWTAEGWLYLAVVLDLFSRMIVGWSMAATQDATLVVQALQMAITRRRAQPGLLLQSDRGSTYTSESYQALLRQAGMLVSMRRTADCYDNAAMESFFHSFKGESIEGGLDPVSKNKETWDKYHCLFGLSLWCPLMVFSRYECAILMQTNVC